MTAPVVIVGDLVESRDVTDRAAFSSRLEAVLRDVNTRHAARILGPVDTVKGIDELSGVLDSPAPIYDIILHINLAVWPQRFRFGAARGEIDIGLGSRRVADMDGPAFHRAAEKLRLAHDAGVLVRLDRSIFQPEAEDYPDADPRVRLIEAAAQLSQRVMASWSERMAGYAAAWLLEGAARGDGAEIAERFGVSKPTVSVALQRAAAQDLVGVRDAIRSMLAGVEPGEVRESGSMNRNTPEAHDAR